MQVASKFLLATVYMLYSAYNRKYFVLLFLPLATPNAPSLPRESKMVILVLLDN